MKFRQKIDQMSWRAMAFSGVFGALQFRSSRNFIAEVGASTFLIAGIAAIAADRFIYWELSPQCLLIRKLWKREVISWSEVTKVG